MKRALLSDNAKADLKEISDFYDSEKAATRIVDTIISRCKMLAANTGLGRLRSEYAPGLLSFVAGDYVIFYLRVKNGVRIARIMHGARDFSPDDFV